LTADGESASTHPIIQEPGGRVRRSSSWLKAKTSPEPLILVVEDEELLRLHAADLLEEHGFRVIEARNAAAALKMLETRDDVRLLFTDIQMPGTLDGMDLAREVYQRWPQVLLVITSGQKKPAEAEIPDHGCAFHGC
jgi:two-component system, response regulator PdtaR